MAGTLCYFIIEFKCNSCGKQSLTQTSPSPDRCVSVCVCECFYVFACSAQHKSHNNNNSSGNRGSGRGRSSNMRWRSNILPLPLAKVAPEKRGKDPDRTLSHIDFCHGRINHRPRVPLRRFHCCRGGFPVSFPPRQATKQMQSAWVQLFSLAYDSCGTYVACVDCMYISMCGCVSVCGWQAGRLTFSHVQLASNWACPTTELMLLMICKYLVSQMTHAHTLTSTPMLLHIAWHFSQCTHAK